MITGGGGAGKKKQLFFKFWDIAKDQNLSGILEFGTFNSLREKWKSVWLLHQLRELLQFVSEHPINTSN